MTARLSSLLWVGTLLFCTTAALAADGPALVKPASKKPAPQRPALKVYTDAEHVDADFAYQGEYAGDVLLPSGKARLGCTVRALGDGNFRTVFLPGGLPGDGWDGKSFIQKSPSTDAAVPTDSKLVDGKVVVDHVYKATVDGHTVVGKTDAGAPFELQRVERRSPTLGAKPPAGAIVLFDGTNTNEWQNGAMTEQKWLKFGCTTKRKFQDFRLHVEFLISYVPHTQGIGQRPNSGVYLQQHYEIQILDSFGVTMGVHDCGVLYAQITPKINMCYPPLRWQTYDIDFTAARYKPSGEKIKLANTTVQFNGVMILDHVDILHSTPGGTKETPEPAGIYLQSHGLPVFFQNVWVVPKEGN